MTKIVLNDFNNSCLIQGKQLKLTPDSYTLLKLLYQANYEPVEFQLLKQHIWSDDYQPDYSLKRLARELQNALATEAINLIQIVEVDGVGYALKKKTSSRLFFLAAFMMMAVIMYLFVNIISPMVRSASMVNNRIVFLPQELPRSEANIIYHEAADQLRILVVDSDLLLLINAPKNKVIGDLTGKYSSAGLIIEWYRLNETQIQLEIIEAITGNQLLTIALVEDDINELESTLRQVVRNLEQLITSELLPLSDAAIADPYDTAWDGIRSVLQTNLNDQTVVPE